MHVDCNHCCHRLLCFLWIERLVMYCSVLEEEKKEKKGTPRKMVWFIGFYPDLFLTRNDRSYFGKISCHFLLFAFYFLIIIN